MSRVYWDTMLFVYWMEGHSEYAKRVQELNNSMKRRRDLLCTSAFALGEILVKPYKLEKTDLMWAIQDYFQSPAVELLPFDAQTAQLYASIRAEHNVSAGDAIHLGTAAQAHTDLFLTNDRRLCGLRIPGIQFIAGLDTKLL